MSALPPALAFPGSLLAKQGGGQHQHPIGPLPGDCGKRALVLGRPPHGLGTACLNSSRPLTLVSVIMMVSPVALPPGCPRLATWHPFRHRLRHRYSMTMFRPST